MRLKELRTQHNMRAEDVGDAIGVDRATVFNWEAGKGEPKASQIKKLADLFGVTTDYLLGR